MITWQGMLLGAFLLGAVEIVWVCVLFVRDYQLVEKLRNESDEPLQWERVDKSLYGGTKPQKPEEYGKWVFDREMQRVQRVREIKQGRQKHANQARAVYEMLRQGGNAE